jgi:hypothetical protein
MPRSTTPTTPINRGTREQYESEWVEIFFGASHTFLHNLEEVPWVVSVQVTEQNDGSSRTADGKNVYRPNADLAEAVLEFPLDAAAHASWDVTDRAIIVTSDYDPGSVETTAYFRVRAM